jgi:hypothetical protein
LHGFSRFPCNNHTLAALLGLNDATQGRWPRRAAPRRWSARRGKTPHRTHGSVRPIAARQLADPRDLMVHCAQEMGHLAGFLAELYAALVDP